MEGTLKGAKSPGLALSGSEAAPLPPTCLGVIRSHLWALGLSREVGDGLQIPCPFYRPAGERKIRGEVAWRGGRKPWVQISAGLLINCVPLGELFKISESVFSWVEQR